MKKLLTFTAFLSFLLSFTTSCAPAKEKVVYFNEETKNTPVIVARLEAQEGKTELLINMIDSLVIETRKESGNLSYNVYQDIDVPTKFIIYEVWESQAALKNHTETAHLKNFRANKAEVVKGDSDLTFFERSISTMPKSSEGSLVLFANITSIDGKAAELQTILEDLIVPTLAEDGAEHYELHKLNGDANGFMFHETWTTVAQWDAHMLTDHLVKFLGVKDNYVAGDIAISRTKQLF